MLLLLLNYSIIIAIKDLNSRFPLLFDMFPKSHFLLKTLIVSVFFLTCLHDISAQRVTQHITKIDYDTLSSIHLELKFEIGKGKATSKNDGTYLAGQLDKLIVFPNGYFLVSDRQKKTLELFDSGGKHVKQLAKKGNGPGELPPYFTLDKVGFNKFAVRDGQTNTIYLYSLTDQFQVNHLTTWSPSLKNNLRLDIIAALTPSSFLAVTTDWKKEIALNIPEYKKTIVKVINDSFEVKDDSVHVLKKANSLFGDPKKLTPRVTFGGLAILGKPPYRFEDHLIPLGREGYIIAKSDDSTIYKFNTQCKLYDQIKLIIKNRKVADSDLDNAFRNHEIASKNMKIRQALESYVKELKPPFLNIWVSDKNILLHTDYSSAGNEYVLLNSDNGTPMGKFYLSEFEKVQQLKNGKIYTLNNYPFASDTIKIYQIKE